MVVGLVDDIFHALADGTRRDIVERTLQTEYSVSALARLYPMTFAAVQKHVVVLERATLVTKRKQGREMLVNRQHRFGTPGSAPAGRPGIGVAGPDRPDGRDSRRGPRHDA